MTDILRLQKEDIDIARLLLESRDDADGAQLVFVGTVRNDADSLSGLEIEAFVPAAEKDLADIAHEAEEKFGVRSVHIVHRYGYLSVGDVIVVTIICAAHRGEAYDASRFVIEKIKEKVPIWKKEVLSNGKQGEWVH